MKDGFDTIDYGAMIQINTIGWDGILDICRVRKQPIVICGMQGSGTVHAVGMRFFLGKNSIALFTIVSFFFFSTTTTTTASLSWTGSRCVSDRVRVCIDRLECCSSHCASRAE
mmetsp:Transcript_26109/g.71608  ORF Transcript_26109/g.71608 Transcript_26109/m.71608 type:complete len:113 (-) Transcript_26109:319-657(-)